MGCQSNTPEHKQSNPVINVNPGNNPETDKLIKTINEYYNLEKNELWDKAYDYRTPTYRKVVLKDYYIKRMSEDNEGWHLVKFEIVDLKIDNNRATARIKFMEKSPREVNVLGHTLKDYNNTIQQDTKWIKYGETWFSLEPGTRTHLHENVELVIE